MRYISGKITTAVAKMAEYQVMVSLTPQCASTHAPTARLRTEHAQQQIAYDRGRQHERQREDTASSTPLTARGSRAT